MSSPELLHEELVFEGKQIIYDAPQLYVDVDIEADGKAGHGSMLSIGAVAPLGEKFYVEIKPLDNDWIEQQRQFCEDHGLERERLLQEGLDPYEATKRFVNWTQKLSQTYDKSAVFSAFNASFDYSFVDLYIHKANLDNPYQLAPFDLKSAAQQLSGGWDWAKTNKVRLPREVLPIGEFAHHALKDAVYQQEIHFALAALINRMRTS